MKRAARHDGARGAGGEYVWAPGRGPAREAVEAMRLRFRKPARPMGEAWFMSPERTLFQELSEKPVAEIAIDNLESYLYEISSGTSCFGHFDEWEEWLRYMLPDLILRSHESYAFSDLIEPVVTAFMCIFWEGLGGEYADFRADVLDSLSLCLMKDELWCDWQDAPGEPTYKKAKFLVWEDDEGHLSTSGWDAGRCSRPFSSMMFFCLKYLEPGEIASWVRSLVEISDPYWRGTLMVWLLGAHDLLLSEAPAPSLLEAARPQIGWADSHVLGSRYGGGAAEPPEGNFNDNGFFLSPDNNRLFLSELRKHVSPETVLGWADSFAAHPPLEHALLNTADLFFHLLFGR